MRFHVSIGLRRIVAIVMAVALAGVLGASASAQTTISSCESQVSSQTEITVNGQTIEDEQFTTVSDDCGSPETDTDTGEQTSEESLVAEADSSDEAEEDAGLVTEELVIPDVVSDEEIAQVVVLLIAEILAEFGI